MPIQVYDVKTIDRIYAANAALVEALEGIIKYEEDTEWVTMSGKPPADVTSCADMARTVLNLVQVR